MEWSARNVTIIGILLAVITIVTPIGWDYYTHRSGLEFRIESSTSLLPADPLLKDFLITYQGKPIRNLTRMDFTLVNSGNSPITSDDIIEEPTIKVQKESGIIAAIPVSTDPRNLYVDLLTDLNDNEIKIKFNLLNPGDYIRLAIYLNGSTSELPTIIARIKGIKEINVIDNIPNEVKTENKPNWVIENIMILIKYIGIIFLILFLSIFGKQTLVFHRTKSRVKKNPKFLEEFDNINDIKKFIGKNLSALSPDQKKMLLMKEIEDAEKDFTEENKSRLIAAINNALNTRSGSEMAFIFFVIISIVFAYIYWPIFY